MKIDLTQNSTAVVEFGKHAYLVLKEPDLRFWRGWVL